MKPFVWPVRIYYEDTDAGGVVFYANYLKFLERARTEMLRDMGFELDQLARDERLIFVVREVSLDYLKPAKFNEEILVSAYPTKMKPASLIFVQEITRSSEVLCRGQIRIACVGTNDFRPKLIPEYIIKKMNYEN